MTFVTRVGTTHFPLDGTLIIKLQISHAMVGRVLMHNGLEGNIIFKGATKRMVILGRVSFKRDTIQTFDGTLLYTMEDNIAYGTSKIVQTFDDLLCHGLPSLYNATLGREWLHRMGKIPYFDNLLSRYPAIRANIRRSNAVETK
ncbi:hypothetical protein C1H46_003982 [Malus baccata]|uniref:Uncharacterized protein n=1 Tax=Malus baccata TaxID=106549 RepID=A0A540NH66_MALBA|nr:hypothetical protein C1H46_003982 [Malus baccata]